jgi:citrate lyase synthetase
VIEEMVLDQGSIRFHAARVTEASRQEMQIGEHAISVCTENQQPVRATVEAITTAREARTSIIACGSMAGGERRRRKTPLPAISIHRQARATKDRIKVSLITT